MRYSDIVNIKDIDLIERIRYADIIFFGSDYPTAEFVIKYKLDMKKVWIVGTKDFGNSNGIHYNRKITNFKSYRTTMKKGVLECNISMEKKWKKNYINLISLICDDTGKVLVFTPDGKFLSQDTSHLTRDGAKYFAKLLTIKLRSIINLT
jgi:hypothetical protein